MSLVELFRIGSDPELSFAVPDDKGAVHLLSADKLVGQDRDIRLRSFIGTDGHPSTAELRPHPCNNVYWHLLKVADGLAEVRKGIRYFSNKKGIPIVAVAQPSLGKSETMGGHIWISMWYKSKLSADAVHGANVIWDSDSAEFYPSRQGRAPSKPMSPSKLQHYLDEAKEGREISVDLCWMKLHYLLYPLEMMLYGPHRGDRVGIKDPYVRLPDAATETDRACFKPGYAYFRFEYRIPTTWLQHPTLAFAYLGLAKLAILNWDLLPNLKDLRAADANRLTKDNTTGWRSLLKTRLASVMDKPTARSTRDLRGLFDAVDELYKVSLKFPALIDFDAWASLKPNRG